MFLELFDLSSDEAFGYEADVFISAIAFGVTVALWRMVCAWCEVKLPGWEKFPKTLQDRMCVETAILPIRLGLIYFSFPAVATAFTSPETWKAVDTKNSLIARYVYSFVYFEVEAYENAFSSLMTGAYLFDLSIHRDDILSIIHHCMGPALLLWIRTSFSAFDSSDALICRPLMMFVFFGAGLGGTASSISVLLLRIGKKYISPDKLYQYFASCLAVLTVSTVASCYLNTAYLLHTHDSLYGHFGILYSLPIIWEGFECYLQWRWLLRFHEFESKFWDVKREPKQTENVKLPMDIGIINSVNSSQAKELDCVAESADMMKGVNVPQVVRSSFFPSWTVPLLKVLTGGWSVMFVLVCCRFVLSIYQEYGTRGRAHVAMV